MTSVVLLAQVLQQLSRRPGDSFELAASCLDPRCNVPYDVKDVLRFSELVRRLADYHDTVAPEYAHLLAAVLAATVLSTGRARCEIVTVVDMCRRHSMIVDATHRLWRRVALLASDVLNGSPLDPASMALFLKESVRERDSDHHQDDISPGHMFEDDDDGHDGDDEGPASSRSTQAHMLDTHLLSDHAATSSV